MCVDRVGGSEPMRTFMTVLICVHSGLCAVYWPVCIFTGAYYLWYYLLLCHDLHSIQDESTPLLTACRHGRLDIVHLLLCFNADVNARNKVILLPHHTHHYHGDIYCLQCRYRYKQSCLGH